MSTIENGLDLWQAIAETQNKIIRKDKVINKDNPEIWQGYLHRWDNADWEAVLIAVATLNQQHPDMFKKFQKDAFQDAAKTLIKHMDTTDRVLDKKLYKHKAWKMIMVLRELWNSAPKYTPPAHKKETRLNEFNNLYV